MRQTKRSSRTKDWIQIGASLLISFFLLYNIVRAIVTTQQKLDTLESYRQETAQIRKEYLHLYIQSQVINSDQYIEKIARNDLNYAKDGDIVFIVPDELLYSDQLETLYESIVNPQHKNETPVYQEWLELIKYGV